MFSLHKLSLFSFWDLHCLLFSVLDIVPSAIFIGSSAKKK